MKKIFLMLVFLAHSIYAMTITDILDRKVEIKDKKELKIALGFYFEEYFAVAGEDGFKNIVGWSKRYWLNRRQSTWDEFYKAYPQIDKIPDIGYTAIGTLSVEKIISLEPDVLIMPMFDYKKIKDDIKKLENLNIAVVFIDFHKQTLQNHQKSIEILGKILHKEQRAKQINEFYAKYMNLVYERMKNVKHKPRVYVEFSAKEGPSTFGPTYGNLMWGALVQNCGGDNITKDAIKGSSGSVNPELIVSKNPEVIIFAGNYFDNNYDNIPLGYQITKEQATANLDKYAARAGWNEIDAVKNKQIHALYHDLSRHIFDFAGTLYFAKVIQPELFKDIDPEKVLAEFFDKFYPIPLSGTWMVSWQ